MWTFVQEDGSLWWMGERIGKGYSGADPDPAVKGEPGEGVNQPAKEQLRSVGPLPHGRYRICKPFFHETAGPYVMRLLPLPGTDTHGRSGFLIHGDSRAHPGTASKGCIVTGRETRIAIWESGDHELEVVARRPPPGDPLPVA